MRNRLWKCECLWKIGSGIIVKIVKEYVWGACFVFFVLQNTVSDCPKHYVWHPQTVCLTLSNMLFDNFNTCFSCTKDMCLLITNWLSVCCGCTRNTRVFCPSDFRNDFRGHSRDSKRANIDYSFLLSSDSKMSRNRCVIAWICRHAFKTCRSLWSHFSLLKQLCQFGKMKAVAAFN